MQYSVLTQLRDIGDNLSVLAGLLEISGNLLKAHAIRRAEKSLVSAESFFTEDLLQKIKEWQRADNALVTLYAKLHEVEDIDQELLECKKKLLGLQENMQKWLSLPDVQREHLIQEIRLAKMWLDNKSYQGEVALLHRYERYLALKPIVPYADNAEYLCEAIYHFENREKYEANVDRLNKKKEQAEERKKSVNRGIILAVCLSIFIVTIPISLPFALSLWARKREIDQQITNFDETMRREERRIQAADEGVIASSTVKEILGDISLEQLRRTLNEVKDLRAEFSCSGKSPSTVVSLIAFLEEYRSKLEELFVQDLPNDIVDALRITVKNVQGAQYIEQSLAEITEVHEQILARKKKCLRGYSSEILKDSIAKLEEVKSKSLDWQISEEVQKDFFQTCLCFPSLLDRIRESLWHISKGNRIDEIYWRNLRLEFASLSNSFNACILHLNLDNFGCITESGIPFSENNIEAR